MSADPEQTPPPEVAVATKAPQLDEALNELRESAPHMGDLKGIGDGAGTSAAGSAVWQIELDLQVMLGSTAMSVADLLKLEAGGTITLDQDAAQPLELAVNGRAIGYGELVEDAGGSLAIHILSLNDLGTPAAKA